MPNMEHDEGLFAELGDGHHHDDTLNRFEHFFAAPVDVGLLVFGLANAGVVFDAVGDASWAVFVALLVGKTLGIFACSFGGHLVGFPLPGGMDGRALFVAGLTASIGLTVALFVAGVAFADPVLSGSAKMGALFSAAAAPLVLAAARVLDVRGVRAPARETAAPQATLEPARVGSVRPPSMRPSTLPPLMEE
jgi:NhaA family Na+:H+ antiporter